MSDIPGPESNFLPDPADPADPADSPVAGAPVAGAPSRPNGPRAGRIREQSSDTTAPRPETVAEARARLKAQRDRADAQRRAAEDAAAAIERKQKQRKQMIGAGVGVGVVGAIALLYVAASGTGGQETVPVQTATCTTGDNEVVDESYCARGSISPVTGMILLGGLSYRYNYGGTVHGNQIAGGTYDRPANTAFRTTGGAAVDPGKATSFGTNGKTNAAGKAAPPQAGAPKNIKRGGIGAADRGGAKPRIGSVGG